MHTPETLEPFYSLRKKIEGVTTEPTDYVEYLLEQCHTPEGKVKLIRGLNSLSVMYGNKYFLYLSAIAMTLPISDSVDTISAWFSALTRTQITPVSINDIPAISATQHVGFLHGHFRMLTPSSLVHAIQASEHCETLIIGIEANQRTTRFKTEKYLFSDQQRLQVFSIAGISDHVLLIDDTIPYTNKGYRNLVQTIQPSIYFGNTGYPDHVRIELALRARLAGATYKELAEITGLSTSDYFSHTDDTFFL